MVDSSADGCDVDDERDDDFNGDDEADFETRLIMRSYSMIAMEDMKIKAAETIKMVKLCCCASDLSGILVGSGRAGGLDGALSEAEPEKVEEEEEDESEESDPAAALSFFIFLSHPPPSLPPSSKSCWRLSVPQ